MLGNPHKEGMKKVSERCSFYLILCLFYKQFQGDALLIEGIASVIHQKNQKHTDHHIQSQTFARNLNILF